jgi:hypothetical protein
MHKLAAFAAVATIAAAYVTIAPLVIAPEFAFAQEVAVVPASPWAEFWAALQAPLLAFATAVLSALGLIVSYYAKCFLGERAALAVNTTYQMAVDQAAGWLAAKLGQGSAGMAVDPASPVVAEAIRYVRESYPEVNAIEPVGTILAKDVIAAFGRLKR